jgi:hypothetical protein
MAEAPLPLTIPVIVETPVPPFGTVRSVLSVTAPVTRSVPVTLVFPVKVPVVPEIAPEKVPVVPEIAPEKVPVVPEIAPEKVPVVPTTAVKDPAARVVPPITVLLIVLPVIPALLIVPPAITGVLIVGEERVEVEMVTPAIVPVVMATLLAFWVDIVPSPVTWVLAIVIGSLLPAPCVDAWVAGIDTPWSDKVRLSSPEGSMVKE